MTPIGVFDSGYGGLTVLDSIRGRLPEYDYLYLGDNARAPYGGRSFEVVYEFTRQAVMKLFSMGCQLVILGCNTASAKALRTIQQHDLPLLNDLTLRSESYKLEIQKLFPDITLTSVACPLWAPLVEAGEATSPGADYFVKKRIDQLLSADPNIDAVILGCTHYPLLLPKIKSYMPDHVEVISQGCHVAESLENYLQRHPEIESQCSKNGQTRYFTTENPDKFQENARIFLNEEIVAQHIDLQV